MDSQTPPDFELTQDGEVWVATHVNTGIASQGETPTEAVEMVQEASHLHEKSHTPGDETHQRSMLDQFGISLEDVEEEIDTPDGMP